MGGHSSRKRQPLGGLPDVIAPGLRVLFVGINPGLRSAALGHHYAGHANRFWRLLHDARLVPERLTWRDDARIVEWGFGLTNLALRPTRGVGDLEAADFAAGRARLLTKLRRWRPGVVALVGVTVCAAAVPRASGREHRVSTGSPCGCALRRRAQPERAQRTLFLRRDAGGIPPSSPNRPPALASRQRDPEPNGGGMAIASLLSDGRTLRDVDHGIVSALPAVGPRRPYDRWAVAAFYDGVVATRAYNRVIWGTTPDAYIDFERRAITSRDDGVMLDAACGLARIHGQPICWPSRARGRAPRLLARDAATRAPPDRADLRERSEPSDPAPRGHPRSAVS